jgi:prepilin-type N-terminal cleavage/methylation domain-containing protein
MDRMRTGEAGFTLIEVLCAASIAALAITGLYAGLGTSLRATDRLDRHLGARIVAQSILAEVSNEPRGILRSKRGTAGKYAWELQVERATGTLADIRPPGFVLYDLKLAVSWAPDGHIEIKAVRLGQ